MNELNHIKVSFSKLAENCSLSKDSDNYAYYLQRVKKETATFALIEFNGDSRWELIDSTIYGAKGSLFKGFKSGSAYEIENGIRLHHGKRVSVEKYLSFLHDLPSRELDFSEFFLRAKVSLSSERDLHVRNGLNWKDSDAIIEQKGESFSCELIIKTLEDWLLIDGVFSPIDIELEFMPSLENDEAGAVIEQLTMF